MTSDTFRPGLDPKTFDVLLATGKSRFVPILNFIGYVGVFVGYTVIFVISLLTVGFLEIRQANMSDFNALIAVLEQRDRYAADDHYDKSLAQFSEKRGAYVSWMQSPLCSDIGATNVVKPVLENQSGDPEASSTNPKTCAEIKEKLQRHAHELSLTEDEIRFRSANLAFYYDQYKDGITQKVPQIIPALRLLDSNVGWLTLWAR